jgi:hypothetical protein
MNPCDAQRVWHYYYYPSDVRSMESFRVTHQRLNHVLHYELDKFREKIQRDNTDLRISFLRDKISEENYKKILIKREIQRQKDVRMVESLETASQVITPLLQQIMTKQLTVEAFEIQVKQIERFLNDNITEMNSTFKSNVGCLSLVLR